MNEPNEPGSWSDDFSYDYLELLYREITARFRVETLGNCERALSAGGRVAFIRHDVDLSLDRALDLARKEHEWGLRSTYHVMIDCPFYDINAQSSHAVLRDLTELGHEVGLHYDVRARSMLATDAKKRAADIASACDQLEDALGDCVRSVSFHRPVSELLDGPLRVGGRISGYASELFGWYISDSRARWREGPPIESLNSLRSDVLQVLIHPVWWGDGHLAPEFRLRALVRQLAAQRNVRYEPLRDEIADHISFRAAD